MSSWYRAHTRQMLGCHEAGSEMLQGGFTAVVRKAGYDIMKASNLQFEAERIRVHTLV